MDPDELGELIDRQIDYFAANPDEGRGADTPATAAPGRGRRVHVDGPNGWAITTDQPEAAGGSGSAPNPGWFWRAALASCDVTVLMGRAAHVGIDLTDVEVAVESESDVRGTLGIDDDVPAGPGLVRVAFTLSASNADAARLRELVEWTESHSPVGDAIGRPVPVEREVTIE